MSFKRFDPEDIVLSSEIITFPTWYTENKGDTSELDMSTVVECPTQGSSINFYKDYYSGVSSGSEGYVFDATQSKALFSLAYATRPESGNVPIGDFDGPKESEIIFGQMRTLVLGDEDSDFRFGDTVSGSAPAASEFMVLTVDRLRFREKLDPGTCRFRFKAEGATEEFVLAPDVTVSERYLDAGRVYDLALYNEESSSYEYPNIDSRVVSYGYFLPDIGVVLFNTDKDVREDYGLPSTWDVEGDKIGQFRNVLTEIDVRSQETVTSNFIFVRARNAEFNYSTNPSNITGSAGNIRWDVMVNQPQSFITTVGLYNDSNDLLAVAKLSRPLVKDFTKEALIRIKLDY